LYDSDTLPDPAEVVKEEILFLANTFDAKFYHKHWIIYDNYTSNLNGIIYPIYKLGTEESGFQYEDFFGNLLVADAVPLNISKSNVRYRKFVAPVRVENAVKAFYKISEWTDDYEELLYKNR